MLHPWRGFREKLFRKVFSAPTCICSNHGARLASPNYKHQENAKQQKLIQIPQSQATNNHQHATDHLLEQNIILQNIIMRLQTDKMPDRSNRQ
jgi:hypothetical protein